MLFHTSSMGTTVIELNQDYVLFLYPTGLIDIKHGDESILPVGSNIVFPIELNNGIRHLLSALPITKLGE